MYPNGYMSLSWVTQGFLRASTGHGKRVRPLSFLAFGKRAQKNLKVSDEMEEEGRIMNGLKLPPKRRFIARRKITISAKGGHVEDIPIATFQENPESKSPSPVPSTIRGSSYEDHPNWKSWRGRMGRGEYIMFCLLIFPLISGAAWIGAFGITLIGGTIGGLWGTGALVVVPCFLWYVRICADIKRLHDFGLSGRTYLAFCFFLATSAILAITLNWITVPVLLILFGVMAGILFLIFTFLRGTHGPNEYGPDPTGQIGSKSGDLASLAQRTKQLKELGAMKTSGRITESEYEVRRAQILNGG